MFDETRYPRFRHNNLFGQLLYVAWEKPRYWHRVTVEQQRAMLDLYMRMQNSNPALTYRMFRKTAKRDYLNGCIMVPFAGMQLGIEMDGYTHS